MVGYTAAWGPMMIILLAWSLAWKGWALWRAAKRDELGWFVAMLLINTVGILEIIYLFYVTKPEEEAEKKEDKKDEKKK